MSNKIPQNRITWNSQIGFLLAAVGSAVGLGNIWRFSYMTFKFGGGAFLVPYFVALIVAGIPLVILEYGLGHRELGASPLSFSRVRPNWEWAGWWMPISAMFGIMLYYSVVIGYCLIYLFLSINLTWGSDTQTFFFDSLLHISDSPLNLGGIQLSVASATLFVWTICWIICYKEVNRGIERACKIFIPLLFILTLILVGWGITLPGAFHGIKAYLIPDWGKLRDFQVWTAAFGQIFFTLSLGFGIMITYASYLPRRTNIYSNALLTSWIDCLFSFIAGFAVFSVIGFMAFEKGLPITEVIKGGPQLAFVVYPEAINNLPFLRSIFGICFFSVLFLAGISSGISLIEAFSCALRDKFGWDRKKVVSVICLLGFLGSLIFTTRGGLHIIDIVDHFITHYALILGGIIECYIVGWLLKAKLLRKHVNNAMGSSKLKVKPWWDVCIRYITPAALIIILLQSLIQELKTPYEGYPLEAIILFGVDWLIIVLIVSVVFTFYPWKSELLHRKHLPEEDHLLV
ncbi:MAG: sodium-dependent transporter [Candidatus Auribacterota bacterium]|nr:sodium-dependent transporter [Candidatus Auribacterota bacterium]